MVKDQGRHTFIDKVKVRLVDSDYWAEVIELRRQVRPHSDALRPRLRAAPDRRHLGADRHAVRVRRGDQGEESVLDRQARRRSRSPRSTSRSTGGSRRVHDRRVDRPHHSQHGLRASARWTRGSSCSSWCGSFRSRAELQPRRAWAPRHGQELRRPGGVAVLRAAHGRHDRRQPVRAYVGPPEGHGPDLGRRRVRRGRRPPEDAEGGHHDDEDLLRVRHLPAWARGRCRATRASRCSATRTSRST